MPRKRHTAEEIIGKLREVELRIGQGVSAQEAIRGIGGEARSAPPVRAPRRTSRLTTDGGKSMAV